MTFFLSIDDTDSLNSRGTGRLARAIADTLGQEYPVTAVTRHQLFVHESIPYTSHNSCAVIHIGPTAPDQAERIFSIARRVMLEDFVEGSDPGIALAHSDRSYPGDGGIRPGREKGSAHARRKPGPSRKTVQYVWKAWAGPRTA